jgi:hypothetical protein
LLDADMNGSDSIQHLVDAKLINYIPITSHDLFDKTIIGLLNIVGPNDLVILDTASASAETHRWDSKLGNDPTASLMDKRRLYLGGDANYLTVYAWTSDSLMRRLKNLRALDCRIITTSHEDETMDMASLTKKRGPQMNKALYKSIMQSTSDVFRMYELFEPVLNEDGTVKVPSGTRVLQLAKTEEAVAKFHVQPTKALSIPPTIYVPLQGGLHKLYSILGKRPSWLHIYGAEGVGKTAFACSEADEPPKKKSPTSKPQTSDKEATA